MRSSEHGSPAWVCVGTLLLLLHSGSARGGKAASLGSLLHLHITLKPSISSGKKNYMTVFSFFFFPSVFHVNDCFLTPHAVAVGSSVQRERAPRAQPQGMDIRPFPSPCHHLSVCCPPRKTGKSICHLAACQPGTTELPKREKKRLFS